MGAGPIGLMILQAARVHGAAKLIALDVEPGPLAMASRLGAHVCLDARDPDLAERVRAETEGRGADHVLEAVGLPASVQAALELVRRGGTVTLVGIAPAPGVPLDTIRIVRSGISLRSSFRYAHVHPAAIALAAERRVDLETLVTHRYGLADVAQAFDDVARRRDGVVKAVVEMDGR
jgi:L-iditol 2-dehydrogenase